MTRHRFFNVLLGTAGLALLLSTSHLLDGPTDSEAAWDQAEAIKELRAAAPGSARRDAVAARLCTETRGPNSEARWTAEGHLVCTTRRGLWAAQVAGVTQ